MSRMSRRSLRHLRDRAQRAMPEGGLRDALLDRLPQRPWVETLRHTLDEVQRDQIPLLAAGVAFYTFLSLVPTMIAAVTVYGLVADPFTVATQARWVSTTLPESAAELVVNQMETIASEPSASLGVGLLVSVVAVLWTASLGVGNLMKAINMAYDQTETRSYLSLRLRALVMTFGGVVFLTMAIGLITLLPLVLDLMLPSESVRWVALAGRWLGLLVLVMVALGVVYRVAPNRPDPRTPWVSRGAVVATPLWLIASFGFALYVENFARYGETYGALAGVAVLLLWLWVTMFVILFGAEVNAVSEERGEQ